MGDGPAPEVELADEPPSDVADADVVALPYLKDGEDLVLGPGAAELLDVLGLDLIGLLELQGADGSAGEIVEHVLVDAPEGRSGLHRVLLVGVGAATPRDLRRAGAALARCCRKRRRVATSVAALADDAGLRAF